MENMDKSQGVGSENEPGQADAAVATEKLDRSIERSRDFLLSCQDEAGYWVDELGMEYRLDKIIGDFAASLEDRRGFRPVLRDLIAAYSSQPPTPPHYPSYPPHPTPR